MQSLLESILVTILGIFITGAIGLLAYVWQERSKRTTALTERRKELYQKLLRALFKLLVADTGPERSKQLSEIEEGWLFASDDVLEASYNYLELYDHYYTESEGNVVGKIIKDSNVKKEFEQSLANIFFAMRRDLKGIRSTIINKEWTETHTKIYDWGIIEDFE